MPVDLFGNKIYRMQDILYIPLASEVSNLEICLRSPLSSYIQNEVGSGQSILQELQKLDNELKSVISMYSNLMSESD